MPILIAVGLVAVVLLIGAVPVVGIGLALFLGRGEPKPEQPSEKLTEQKEPPPPEPIVIEKPKPPEPPPMSPKVKAALEKGADHLKKRLALKNGRYSIDMRHGNDASVGGAALAGLALLEAKVPPSDPAVQQALTIVREGGPRLSLVYALGAVMFFLNRLDDAAPLNAEDRELARTLAMRVLAGQQADGRWTYLNPPITPEAQQTLLDQLNAGTYKPRSPRPVAVTNSMTQFALLALWGSRRYDVPAGPAIFVSAQRFHQTQNPDGTWDYQSLPNGVRRDSNTCAGLIALAMEKTMLQDKKFRHAGTVDPKADPRTDEQVARAFAHLTKLIGHTKNDPIVIANPNPKFKRPDIGGIFKADAWGDYYFLWCLERVAVIYDVTTIGGKDWYAWGSEIILETQRPDGSWLDRHGDVPDTCFAMLFLCRTNLAKDLTESIRTHGGSGVAP